MTVLLCLSAALVAYGVGCLLGRVTEDWRLLLGAAAPMLLALLLTLSDPHRPEVPHV